MNTSTMNAAAEIRPWELSHKVMLLLRQAGCPWGPTTVMRAAGRASFDDRPVRWLLENGCPTHRQAVMRLICIGRLDLACKALQPGIHLLKSHQQKVGSLPGVLAACSKIVCSASHSHRKRW